MTLGVGSLFSFLFAWFLFYLRGFFFVCVFSFLFACFLFYLRGFFFICVVSFLFACFLFYLRGFFFICVFSFLFAWFLFYLRVFFFVCVFSFLFAWFLFYLRGFFFICVFSFLFACFLFYLRGFFYVCSVSLLGHRRKLHTWSSKEIVTWLKKIITWLVCLHVILSMHSLKARSLSWNPHSNYLDEKILSPEIRKISCIFWFLKVEVSWFPQRVNYNFSKALKSSFSRVCISIIECQQFRRDLLKESHSIWTEVNTFRHEGSLTSSERKSISFPNLQMVEY